MIYKDKQRVPIIHRRHVSHKVYMVAIAFILLMLISSSYFNRTRFNENYTLSTNNQKALGTTSGHYNILFFISTNIRNIHHRRLLREYLFGIHNNLQPCLHHSSNVYYKFLVEPYEAVPDFFLRDFRAEYVEFDDIVEFPNRKGEGWQNIVLDWTQDLAREKNITFNHLVMIKDTTIIDLHKLQLILEYPIINGRSLTDTQKSNIVWGPFGSLLSRDVAIILGNRAIPTIIQSNFAIETLGNNLIGQVYDYYHDRPDETDLFLVNDDVGLIEFPNSVENVPADTTVAVGGIYLEDDLKDVVRHLSIKTTLICYPDNNDNKRPRIAVVTSSFVYDDLCMFPVAKLTADNKRSYALRHGYSFVPRSYEFTQQIYKNRKTVWGKFDAIEKVLPYYDWIFWLDMDTIIANKTVAVESLLKRFTDMVGGEENFEKINLIVARPVHDSMINAGVFLLRNSEWSRAFIRKCQYRTDLYKKRMYEQRAMWDLMREYEWESGVLLLDQDDHTFNTFPSRYVKGDFVVHYAPDLCPSKPILDDMGKIELLEENPEMEISLAHK